MNADHIFQFPIQNHGVMNGVANSLRDAALTPVELWLGEHPFLHWLILHPLGLLAIALLFLLLFAGLISAISRLTENIWLVLLKLPFQFLQWLLSKSSGVFKWAIQYKDADTLPQKRRLADILRQLETLQNQQAELLKELRGIVGDRLDPQHFQ
jgi:hypothetical protein